MNRVGKVTKRRTANLAKLERPDTCQKCGAHCVPDPHHLRRRSQCGDESPENIQWLCRACHEIEQRKVIKREAPPQADPMGFHPYSKNRQLGKKS